MVADLNSEKDNVQQIIHTQVEVLSPTLIIVTHVNRDHV